MDRWQTLSIPCSGPKTFGRFPADAFADYFYLAVQHVGTIEDFKHFLPRMLEILAESPHTFSFDVLSENVRNSDGANWPLAERDVLRDFFRAVPEALGDLGTPEQLEEALRLPWRAA